MVFGVLWSKIRSSVFLFVRSSDPVQFKRGHFINCAQTTQDKDCIAFYDGLKRLDSFNKTKFGV